MAEDSWYTQTRIAQLRADLRAIDARRAALAEEEAALQQHLTALTAVWPKRVVLYAYAGEEALVDEGQALGLEGEALRLFEYAQEYTLEVEVTEDGHVTVIACDNRALVRDDQPAQTQGASYG